MKLFQEIKIYVFQISPVRTGLCAHMDATPLNLLILFYLWIVNFRLPETLTLETRVSAKTFSWKKIFFPINGLVLSLALKQRLWVSRNGLLEHVASKFQFLSKNQRIPLTGSILASINPNFNVLDHQNGDIDRWINYQLKKFVSFLLNIFELS